jgi:hypothetical protein
MYILTTDRLPPPPLHPSIDNKQPPSNTSKCAHFRWLLLVCRLHRPFTVENEHAFARFQRWLFVCHLHTLSPSKRRMKMMTVAPANADGPWRRVRTTWKTQRRGTHLLVARSFLVRRSEEVPTSLCCCFCFRRSEEVPTSLLILCP